jgi:hypothetical protein
VFGVPTGLYNLFTMIEVISSGVGNVWLVHIRRWKRCSNFIEGMWKMKIDITKSFAASFGAILLGLRC